MNENKPTVYKVFYMGEVIAIVTDFDKGFIDYISKKNADVKIKRAEVGELFELYIVKE